MVEGRETGIVSARVEFPGNLKGLRIAMGSVASTANWFFCIFHVVVNFLPSNPPFLLQYSRDAAVQYTPSIHTFCHGRNGGNCFSRITRIARILFSANGNKIEAGNFCGLNARLLCCSQGILLIGLGLFALNEVFNDEPNHTRRKPLKKVVKKKRRT